MYSFKSFIVVLLLTFSTSAKATLVDDTTYFTDTTSGVEWLKLDHTVGYSYYDIITNQLGSGGDFEGWSVASFDLMYDLLDNAGGASEYRDHASPYTDVNAVTTLQSLFGLTRGNVSWMHVLDNKPGGVTSGIRLFDNGRVISNYDNFSTATAQYTFIGTALFRKSETIQASFTRIPEPSTIALMVLVAFGVISMRQKKQLAK